MKSEAIKKLERVFKSGDEADSILAAISLSRLLKNYKDEKENLLSNREKQKEIEKRRYAAKHGKGERERYIKNTDDRIEVLDRNIAIIESIIPQN